MGFFCPTDTNIMICENKGTSSNCHGGNNSYTQVYILNKIPSSTRKENVLLQEI